MPDPELLHVIAAPLETVAFSVAFVQVDWSEPGLTVGSGLNVT